MEEFLPKAIVEGLFAEVPEDADVRLGVRLEGEGGGEWVIRLAGGELTVTEGSREEAALTVVQTVEDWRGALWEGRGGVFGAQATALFRGAAPAGEGGGVAAPGAAFPSATAIQQMAALDGLIRIVVKGEGAGDWATGFKLGPGAIPEEPRTQIHVSAEDAEAMQAGSLDPMSAFMSGRIQVMGDMTLMMQMQAISMAAAAGTL
jgi:hypothetical protein